MSLEIEDSLSHFLSSCLQNTEELSYCLHGKWRTPSIVIKLSFIPTICSNNSNLIRLCVLPKCTEKMFWPMIFTWVKVQTNNGFSTILYNFPLGTYSLLNYLSTLSYVSQCINKSLTKEAETDTPIVYSLSRTWWDGCCDCKFNSQKCASLNCWSLNCNVVNTSWECYASLMQYQHLKFTTVLWHSGIEFNT